MKRCVHFDMQFFSEKAVGLGAVAACGDSGRSTFYTGESRV